MNSLFLSYINVAKTASKNNLQIAILDAKRNAMEAENKHISVVKNLLFISSSPFTNQP